MKRFHAALAALAFALAGYITFVPQGSSALTLLRGNQQVVTRQLLTQQTNYYRATINFNDPSISSGISFGNLPKGASIVDVQVEIVTAFNAGTTNTLTIGTNSTSFNNIVASGDLTGNGSASLGVQVTKVTRGLGQSIANAADIGVFAKYAQSGTAATTGQAIVTIQYIPNNDQ